MKFIQILTTVPDKETGQKIIKILLEEKLSLCCQIIGPIESQYWWQGKIEKGEEYLILIKAKKQNYKKIEKKIKENHPYKVPEIISFEINQISKEYKEYLSKG
ncbi:MAG: divalent-cation tolerance protein CutA [Candidatus Omnitrophica bacterium]|nr:divalent-cation tolerance protein CutA [Candidatus Omnitrophota bacterium]